MKNVCQYSTLDPIECLELHLRAIVLNTYEGKRADVDFAKFFVLNAKVLKVMKFGASGTCMVCGQLIPLVALSANVVVCYDALSVESSCKKKKKK